MLSSRRATITGCFASHLRVISIHTLLAESDSSHFCTCSSQNQFLSALSLRRATWRSRKRRGRTIHFYPRSPCGERRTTSEPRSCLHTFLSTLSLRRATGKESWGIRYQKIFLSTLSLRRATLGRQAGGVHAAISIHALLAESDVPLGRHSPKYRYFYPRSPCGERQQNATKNRFFL